MQNKTNAATIDAANIHNVEAERQLIAAICQAPDTATDICREVHACDFYDADARIIYGQIESIASRGSLPDAAAVFAECLNAGENVAQLVKAYTEMQISGSTFAALNASRYAEIVRDCATRRRVAGIIQRAGRALADTTLDAHTTTAGLIEALCSDSPSGVNSDSVTLGEALDELLRYIDEDTGGVNIATLYTLDAYTGGFQFGELEVIGAETANGKTALALSFAKNAVLCTQTPTLYFSLEMDALKLAARHISSAARVSAGDIIAKRDTLQKQCVRDAVNSLDVCAKGLLRFDTKSNTLEAICAQIRRHVLRYGVRLVFVDYLQQYVATSRGGENVEQATAAFARALKNIAQELQICVVLLSQLRRDNATNARPTLARLRDSGQIAEAADNVFIIDRPEASPETAARRYAAPWTDYTTHETAVVTLEKCRNVAPRSFLLGWNGYAVCFYDLADVETKRERRPASTNTKSGLFG